MGRPWRRAIEMGNVDMGKILKAMKFLGYTKIRNKPIVFGIKAEWCQLICPIYISRNP
jgi:hypothetical protein